MLAAVVATPAMPITTDADTAAPLSPGSPLLDRAQLSATADNPPAASLQPAAPQARPEERVSSSEGSPVSLPLSEAGMPPDAADTARSTHSGAAASGAHLPPLALADAAAALRGDASFSGTLPSFAAPDAGRDDSAPQQPEPTAQQAHMTALAQAEELERSLLTGGG